MNAQISKCCLRERLPKKKRYQHDAYQGQTKHQFEGKKEHRHKIREVGIHHVHCS